MSEKVNRIIRISKKETDISTTKSTTIVENNDQPICTENQIIRKEKMKPIIKLIKKTIIKIDDHSGVEQQATPEETIDVISDCSSVFKNVTISANNEMTNEELIEKTEYQKDVLTKNRNKYSEKDFNLKLTMIDKLLSKLKLDLTFNDLDVMKDKRVKIDKIVLDKKIPTDQFKKKIDLTVPDDKKDNHDPSIGIVISGREYFKKLSYLPLPPEKLKDDPKGKNFGNQSIPSDLLKMINFS